MVSAHTYLIVDVVQDDEISAALPSLQLRRDGPLLHHRTRTKRSPPPVSLDTPWSSRRATSSRSSTSAPCRSNRLYNDALVDHFYTTDVEERKRAVRDLQYVFEDVVGYVFPDEKWGGGRPLYRLYSGGGRDHFYTSDRAERDRAIGRWGRGMRMRGLWRMRRGLRRDLAGGSKCMHRGEQAI